MGQRGNPNWVKGHSANPGGRRAIGSLTALARQHTEEAVKTLLAIMGNGKAPAAARVGAATVILDRGYGKPVQMTADLTNQLNDLIDSDLDDALIAVRDALSARSAAESGASASVDSAQLN